MLVSFIPILRTSILMAIKFILNENGKCLKSIKLLYVPANYNTYDCRYVAHDSVNEHANANVNVCFDAFALSVDHYLCR